MSLHGRYSVGTQFAGFYRWGTLSAGYFGPYCDFSKDRPQSLLEAQQVQKLTAATVVFNDGGTHTIDYTIPGAVEVTNATTVNLVDGAMLESGLWVSTTAMLNIYGGKVSGALSNGGGKVAIYGGDVSAGTRNYTGNLDIYGGSVGSIDATQGGSGQISIHGGTVGGIATYYFPSVHVFDGTVGSISVRAGSLEIAGGLLSNVTMINANCDITGGAFQGSITGIRSGGCEIKGGQFSQPFVLEDVFPLTFYGDLQISAPVLWELNSGKSQVTGTLLDGSEIDQTIFCTLDPECFSVCLVRD